MATTIFPQQGDAGTEEALRRLISGTTINHVIRESELETFGFGGEESTSGLDLMLSAGKALIAGCTVEWSSDVTVTLTDNTTQIIYVELAETSGNIDQPVSDDEIIKTSESATAVWGARKMPLAVVTTSSGSITSVRDIRWFDSTRNGFFPLLGGGSEQLNSTDTLETALTVPIYPYEDAIIHVDFYLDQFSSGIQFKTEFDGLGTAGTTDVVESFSFYAANDTVQVRNNTVTHATYSYSSPQMERLTGTLRVLNSSHLAGQIHFKFANDTGGTSPTKVEYPSYATYHLLQPAWY